MDKETSVKKVSESNQAGSNQDLKELIKELRSRVKELEEKIMVMEKAFAQQLKRRDDLIDELKRNNDLLLKTALKESEKNEELRIRLRSLLHGKSDSKNLR